MLDKILVPSCAICDEPITAERESREHAIPAAIGGRLKVKGFICRRCNSDSGSLSRDDRKRLFRRDKTPQRSGTKTAILMSVFCPAPPYGPTRRGWPAVMHDPLACLYVDCLSLAPHIL
jgi:hypothetical protein